MAKFDDRIDDYIAKSGEFAKPVLNYLRELVHEASPDVTETMKWSMPFFDQKGPICTMATFKAYSSFGFWKATLLNDKHGVLKIGDGKAGSFGPIVTIADLPPKEILLGLIKQAIALNENGEVAAKKAPVAKGDLVVPDYVTDMLKANPVALFNFEKFSTSQKREYVDWIVEAKTHTTRDKRLQTALEWIAEGKTRNWKYK